MLSLPSFCMSSKFLIMSLPLAARRVALRLSWLLAWTWRSSTARMTGNILHCTIKARVILHCNNQPKSGTDKRTCAVDRLTFWQPRFHTFYRVAAIGRLCCGRARQLRRRLAVGSDRANNRERRVPAGTLRVRTGKINAPRHSAGGRPAFGTLCLAAVVALLAVTTDPADARGASAASATTPPRLQPALRRHRGRRQYRRVLHDANADSLRHPASLTKIMTLYLLFEQLEAGKITLDTPMEVSAHAAQPGADQARAAPGPDHLGRGRDQGRWSPSRPTTPPWWSPRRSAATKRLRPHDDAQGARARHEPHRLPQRLRPAGRRAGHHRARPGDCSASRSRSASRATTAISRRRASSIAATRCATTTGCSAGSKASTASRPATPAPPASIS